MSPTGSIEKTHCRKRECALACDLHAGPREDGLVLIPPPPSANINPAAASLPCRGQDTSGVGGLSIRREKHPLGKLDNDSDFETQLRATELEK